MTTSGNEFEDSNDGVTGGMAATKDFHFDENFLEYNNSALKASAALLESGNDGAVVEGRAGGKRKQKDIFISSLLNNTLVEKRHENQILLAAEQTQQQQRERELGGDSEGQQQLTYAMDSCEGVHLNNNNNSSQCINYSNNNERELMNTVASTAHTSSSSSSSPLTTTTTNSSPLSISPTPTRLVAAATSLDKGQQQQPIQITATSADDGEPGEDDEDFEQPLSERWSPLGANYEDGALSPTSELLSPVSELELLSSADSQLDKHEPKEGGAECGGVGPAEQNRLRNMEEEQELLTSSLMALTSHFAHVQLRVRQIVEAPSHERDQLLKDLEEFAFRGIPEPITSADVERATSANSQHEDAQERQCELIEQLKTQLSDLEKMAYEAGAPVLPQHILLEKQKVIIDELKSKLNLKVDEHDLPELSAEELKSQVDNAIGEFVGPLRMKEQLVAQLKTQITDLERFIAFLQYDSDDPKMKTLDVGEKLSEAYNSYAAKKKGASASAAPTQMQFERVGPKGCKQKTVSCQNPQSSRDMDAAAGSAGTVRESLNSKAHGLIDKASLLMQMFASTHFGSRAEQFQKNTLKKTTKGNHWGDLRAQLEVDIQEVASLAATLSFDREKLANMRRALKKAPNQADKKLTASNGALTTVAPRGRGRRGNPSAMNYNELKPYVSSDSEEDTDDPYEYFSLRHKGGDSISTISKELTAAVRKNFCMTLLALIQHGLRVETESATSSLIVPFMRCLNPSPVFAAEHGSYRDRDFAPSSFLSPSHFTHNPTDDEDMRSGLFGSGSRPMHAWELILEYYYLKHGDEYNNTPARKLSESFNLHMVDSSAVTVKQNLLSAIGMIIAMHRPYKRSCNAHFKAFVSAALNSHQLVEWLSLIFSCSDLIETYYTPNSYVARTGFRDSLRSIEALTKYDFDLPVDLAVRHFRNI